MLVLVFSLLLLAEQVCAASAAFPSLKTALLMRQPIIVHIVSHKQEVSEVFLSKVG